MRQLGLKPSGRIDCPLDSIPQVVKEGAEPPNSDLDEYRGPRMAVARVDEAAAKKSNLPAGWYWTAGSPHRGG
jgi:hypothetical protein